LPDVAIYCHIIVTLGIEPTKKPLIISGALVVLYNLQ
jgi:hypothetical protein